MATYTSDLEKENAAAVEEPPSEPRRPRSRRRLIALIVLLVLLIAGGGYYLYSRDRVSTDDAQVDGNIVPIAAKISGKVQEVLVDDNQQVKAGDVLVRIDPRDFQTRVDQARAALAIAQSQARGARAGVPLTAATTESGTSAAAAQVASAEAELNRAKVAARQASTAELAYAQANVEAAQANYDRAQADLNRMRPLAEKAEISQQQYDSYVAAARVADSQLRAARERFAAARDTAQSSQAGVNQAQARLEQARAGLAQSRAQRQQVSISAAQASSASGGVEQAKANLAAAELELSYTTITAPVDGVVTKKSVQVGQIVQPAQPLMSIVPLQQIWVTANFKETQLKNVRPGQRADVHIDMYGRKFSGHVDSIAGATGSRLSLLPPENASGNYVKVVQRIPVKIVLDPLPPGFVLRPGMNANVTIFTA